MTDTTSVKVRWTEEHEKDMFAYSHSIMEAILTCPVWGVIRYVNGKYYPHTNRQMALEAGGAMHDVFAAVRLWQILRVQGLEDHFWHHGARLFGDDRNRSCFQEMLEHPRDELINYCYNILNSGEFYDDPSDTTRTLSHMEETIIRYVDDRMPRMDRNPIWIGDLEDPTAPVGVELTFDIIVEYDGHKMRYIGTADGIVHRSEDVVMVDENKTASRLDETWRRSFTVKTQPVGYIIPARMLTKLECSSVRIIGCKVKQSRSAEDMLSFIEEKDDHHVMDWVRSLAFAHEIAEKHKENPLDAPKFTHSCSRYFRSCAFIDLCAAEPVDQQSIYENMVDADLTPSQKAIKEGTGL